MSATTPEMEISEADYFVMAEAAERPLEYIDGALRPRASASQDHLKIASRVALAFYEPLFDGPYEMVGVGLRVKSGPGTRYYYPDIMVFHDDAQFDERAPDTLLSPILLAEILSDSTQNIDRGEKLDAYLSIPSLQNYLLIEQNRVRIEHFHRNEQNQWIYDVYNWNRDEIFLDFLNISVPVSEIYRRLNLPEGMLLSEETETN